MKAWNSSLQDWGSFHSLLTSSATSEAPSRSVPWGRPGKPVPASKFEGSIPENGAHEVQRPFAVRACGGASVIDAVWSHGPDRVAAGGELSVAQGFTSRIWEGSVPRTMMDWPRFGCPSVFGLQRSAISTLTIITALAGWSTQ